MKNEIYILTKEQLEELLQKQKRLTESDLNSPRMALQTVDLPEPVTVPTWEACLLRRNEVENWPADAAFEDGIDCICEALKIKSPC